MLWYALLGVQFIAALTNGDGQYDGVKNALLVALVVVVANALIPTVIYAGSLIAATRLFATGSLVLSLLASRTEDRNLSNFLLVLSFVAASLDSPQPLDDYVQQIHDAHERFVKPLVDWKNVGDMARDAVRRSDAPMHALRLACIAALLYAFVDQSMTRSKPQAMIRSFI